MTDADQQDPSRETAESGPQHPEDGMTDEDLQYPFGTKAGAGRQQPPQDPPKPARNTIFNYAAIILGLGILVGVAIAAMPWLFGNSSGRNDLGTVVSSPDGLNGHLYTEWDGQLEYRLKIEPGDQSQLAGFALAISHVPRPVSFNIQLMDSEDHVLCGMNILLKYDPAITSDLSTSAPEPRNGQPNADNSSHTQTAHETNAAQLQADELERERGNDLFQNVIGQNGQIAAISSKGTMPCSKRAWSRAVSWIFTSNFPSLDEQNALHDAKAESLASAANLSARIAARKRGMLKPAQNLASYSIEGDDAIVEYDVTRGIVETISGKTFLIYKKSGEDVGSKWQDYPVSIHYRCDRTSMCTLTNAGAGALRARMSR